MEGNLSQSTQGAPPMDMEEIAQSVQILPEKTLNTIAKGPLVKLILNSTDIGQVTRVWESLILTLSTPSLSSGHSLAVCNATSAFLDAASNAQNEETKKLALDPKNWMTVFDVFLSRYEDAKPKALKLLLGSLATILAKHLKGDTRRLIQQKIVTATFPSVVLGEPRSRLKGSLVCLEWVIRKHAILPSEFIQLIQSWLVEYRERWVPVFEKDCHNIFARNSGTVLDLIFKDLDEEFSTNIFFLGLLTQTNNRELSGTAGGLIATFLQRLKSESPTRNLSNLWVAPVRHMALQNMENIELLSSQLLEPLFAVDPAGFRSFVDSLPFKSFVAGDMSNAEESELILLFSTLQMGKKSNLVLDDFDSSKPGDKKNMPPKLVLKSEVVGRFLFHNEPKIRVAALSLLITGLSTVKPLTTSATTAILRGLPSMHADSDAYSRGEIMSLARKFIIRLKGGVIKDEDALEASQSTQGQQNAGPSRSEEETRKCLEIYIDLLQKDLCVTASYARHISALKALNLLLVSGLDPRADVPPAKSEVQTHWKSHFEVFSTSLLRLLVDLLLDPFEEVRHTALSIINLFPRGILFGASSNTESQQVAIGMRLIDALSRAENTASKTSRADHADTVARLYHILFCAALSEGSPDTSPDWWSTKFSVVDKIITNLEERLSSPKGLFNSTMREVPLHGYISGLRYIILMPHFHGLVSSEHSSNSWRSIHSRIVNICDRVWQEVKPVLCIDSPEGHTDEPIEDLSVGPKDILSYSWRALRESSLLLNATMANVTYGPDGVDGLALADFEKVGQTSFTQLAELRHRGAFSTVSNTFATCCSRCSRSSESSIQELPREWYQQAKKTIFESASKLTRRSAGIPALVTGVLCAAPGTPFFREALNELHDISRLPVEYNKEKQYLELPQVHAMNCLKDIFINNKLGPHTERFIMPALTLSAERLASPIWALRNSGLMLFRALLTRMCRAMPNTGGGFGGESGSEPGSQISFPKYPGLLELLSSLLTTSEGAAAEGTEIITERIFPALELIGEKIPTLADSNDTTLCDLVSEHFKSPVWGIREHAARVYASLLSRTNILADIHELLNRLRGPITENYVHGTVLSVRFALRRYAATTDVYWTSHLDNIVSTIRQVLATVFPVARSPFVAATLVDILNDTLERSFQANIEDRAAALIRDLCQEHDIQGIMDHVFDDCQANWKLSSTTRAGSLLRRSLVWCRVLTTLGTNSWDELPTFFNAAAAFDPDSASWICEKLDETLGLGGRYTRPIAGLYSSLILGQGECSVQIVAASNLASILEEQLASEPERISQLDLPYEDLTRAFQPQKDFENWNRQATDAGLRLQGCFLALRTSIEGLDFASLNREIHDWTIKLRSALSEETEFTTRYAAISSLRSFSRGFRTSNGAPRVDSILLDVYLILYDLLNDDDEEIRDVAASTASWILSYSPVSPEVAVILGPLNASSLLARFITEEYSDSAPFARRVIRYLTGQEPRISGSDNQTHLVAVSDLIAEYRRENTVLFVEEKQNLFIDYVREVDVWSPVLVNLKKNACPETLVRQLSSWVSEGLQYLSSLVSQEEGKDGLLGWLSNPDSFALGVRVISISAALASPEFVVPEYLEVEQQALHAQLQSLHEAGQSASLHGQWLARIQDGLDLGSKAPIGQ